MHQGAMDDCELWSAMYSGGSVLTGGNLDRKTKDSFFLRSAEGSREFLKKSYMADTRVDLTRGEKNALIEICKRWMARGPFSFWLAIIMVNIQTTNAAFPVDSSHNGRRSLSPVTTRNTTTTATRTITNLMLEWTTMDIERLYIHLRSHSPPPLPPSHLCCSLCYCSPGLGLASISFPISPPHSSDLK